MTLKLLESGAIAPEEVRAWSGREGSSTIFNEDGTLNYDALRSEDEFVADSVTESFMNIDRGLPTLANDAVEDAYNEGTDYEFSRGVDDAKDDMVKFGG